MNAAGALAAALLGAAGPAPVDKVGFDEAVRRALARNPGAVVAAEEVRRAEGILGEARSGSLPFLGVTGTLTWLDSNRVAQGRVIAGESQANATGLVAVPLLAPSRWALWAHASQGLDAAAANEADVRRSVAVTTARAYLTVIAQRRAVDVSLSARDAAKAHHDYAQARRKGGVGNALDELRAEQELAASEVQLQAVQIGLARGREALGQLVGADGPLDAAEEPGLPELPGQAEAMVVAESARADVKAAQARAYVAERVWKDSWTDWLPTLTGTFQPFVQDPPSLQFPASGWQAQLILSFPLFEGGLRPAQGKQREALFGEARAQLDGIVRQARSDVRTAYEALDRSRSALQSARRGSESARSALGLAAEAYRAGAVDNLAVTDAEQRARLADLSAVIAEDSVRQSVLDLLAAAGRFP
ncbi:MAG TPA: TolC family protein [Anaeromyxobacteraceae bacterium]|nr:TolC family protein [Anaeromyxobacteraceae bacterium]